MTALLVSACAVLGLVVGSFLNVVIARVPKKESVVRPRSRCPGCGAAIAPRDNVPVLSWLALRGRCRSCGERISARYPLVEVTTAALFALTALRLGLDAALPAFLVFVAALVAITPIDLELRIVPNRIVYPTLFVSAPLLLLAAAIDGDWASAREAAIGGVAAFAMFFVLWYVSPKGMGYGDVRLSGVIGMFLGWLGLWEVALGLFLAFLSASVIGVALMAAGRKGRKDAIPFGPFLALGAVLALLVGDPLLRWYGV
jgi:leader peptidase (prepilin peptidase) / N-methyltransferase